MTPTPTPLTQWMDVLDAVPAALDAYPILMAALVVVALVAAAAYMYRSWAGTLID